MSNYIKLQVVFISNKNQPKNRSAQKDKLPTGVSYWVKIGERLNAISSEMARVTGLEPAASGVTGRRSNQLSYTR